MITESFAPDGFVRDPATGGGGGISLPAGSFARTYVRNPHWPEIATPGSESIRALFKVVNGASKLAFAITGGDYTVDWGDGATPENFTAGTAEHSYTYADADLVGSEAPCTASAGVVTRVGHGLSNGDTQSLYDTGAALVQTGFVVNSTANTFQLSDTAGGAPQVIADGSYQLLPYRIAVVEVTPQAGETWQGLDGAVHPTGESGEYDVAWLEVRAHLPNLVSFPAFARPGSGAVAPQAYSLEHLILTGVGHLSDWSYAFRYLKGLKRLEADFSGAQNLTGTFYGTENFIEASADFSNVQTMNATFLLSGIQYFEAHLPACTTLLNCFYNSSLLNGKLTGTGNVQIWENAFYGCQLPNSFFEDLDVSGGSDFTAWLYNNDACTSLVLDTPSAAIVDRVAAFMDALVELDIDFSSVATTPAVGNSNHFMSGSENLTRLVLRGVQIDFGLRANNLGRAALVELFTHLANVTGVGGRTVDVSTAPGSASLSVSDLAIAQNKGWTVTA